MSQAIAKEITNAILSPVSPLSYKAFQHVITKNDGWIIIKQVLHKISPHLGGKAEDLKKQIYDLRVISSEGLASFINRSSIPHKDIILYRQDVIPQRLL